MHSDLEYGTKVPFSDNFAGVANLVESKHLMALNRSIPETRHAAKSNIIKSVTNTVNVREHQAFLFTLASDGRLEA